jgi:hypothetical protein
VIISKDILKLIKRDAPKVPVFAMANKQDKPNAMKPEVVQKILGIPTYPMVAIDKDRRDEMLRILMTAASQFVGVALPDLPASELLKFTDTATEEAIAEVDAIEELREEEAEEEEEYEEVYVDEDGQIIEDLDEYEIIEEEVEVIEEEVVTEDEIEVSEEEVEPVDEEEEIPVEAEAEPEEPIEVEIEDEEAPEPEEVEDFEVPTVDEDVEEIVEVEIEPEVKPPAPELKMRVRVMREGGPELIIEENFEAMKMAKDLIFEALEADDIIAAELEQVSAEDIDTALEAIGSDEAIPLEGEPNGTEEVDEESLMELESILGPLERSVGGLGSEETNDAHLPLNGETLAELDRLLETKESEDESE